MARRWQGLIVWSVVVAVLGVIGLGVGGRLHRTDVLVGGTDAARAQALTTRAFGSSNAVLVLLEGRPGALERRGPRVAAELRSLRHVRVLDPWQSRSALLRPRAGRALLLVNVDLPFEQASRQVVPRLRAALTRTARPPVAAHMTGYIDIADAIHGETVKSIERAELIAAPVLLIILLLVLGSPIAAGVPMALGGAVVAAAGGVLDLVNRVHPLDAAALNLATMMGLALGVDYALLVVTRFREERAAGRSVDEAVAVASRTAGRTVRFAGLVLGVASLTTLVLAPGGILTSATAGVLVSTALAVLGATIGLPGVLRLLGDRLNRHMLVRPGSQSDRWGSVAMRVIRRPALAAGAVLVALAALAAPALGLDSGPPDPETLPASSPARQDFEAISRAIGGAWGAPFQIVVVSHRGAITERRRLAALAHFERTLERDRAVQAVFGPGTIARRTRALAELPRRLADGRRELGRGRHQLGRLESGLDQAGRGVDELRAGLSAAAAGAQRLSGGTAQAARRGRPLADGLALARRGTRRLAAGAGRLAAGLRDTSRGSARLGAGSRRLAAGVRRMRAQLEQALPDVTRLAAGLSDGATGLAALREPAELAEHQVAEARAALDAMLPTSKADPAYQRAYRAVATAQGAITGRNPLTGQRVRDGYDGLPAALAQAGAQSHDAASGARALEDGLRELAAALQRAGAGARELTAGTARLSGGAGRLRRGAAGLRDGADALGSGVARAQHGVQALLDGTGRLERGARRLAGGLSAAAPRSERLSGGLARIQDGGRRFARRSDALGAQLGGSRRLGPAMTSGYATLAALDRAPARDRGPASFAVNLDRGGTAVQMLVVQRGRPTRADNPLRARLERMAARLGRETDSTVAVGGPATALADFERATTGGWIPLVLALVVVTYLTLVPVLRSLVLPLIAVALNVLTVLAAFGALALAFGPGAPLGGPGFVDAIMVSAVLSVVFALSIDYEVFLLSRMREGYDSIGTTDGAIAYGLRHTAGVITGAAAIMAAVFAAFAASPLINMRELGLGLTVAVVLDATLVRLVLLPAALRLAGPAAWRLPRRYEAKQSMTARTPSMPRNAGGHSSVRS